MTLTDAEATEFIRANTMPAAPPLLPGLTLQLATEITPIWQATEIVLQEIGVEPPFWAFAWAGGQAVARYIADHPEIVSGKDIVDFGAGSGLIAIAAEQAGAARVRAIDIDPVAAAAIRLNAAANQVSIEVVTENVIGRDLGADLILVGDMCYERELAETMIVWLRGCAGRGVRVLLGDPGRTYRPAVGLREIARYTVPTSLELEDRTEREAVVWELLPD
jgi:predicted nicotinamide N-methyase